VTRPSKNWVKPIYVDIIVDKELRVELGRALVELRAELRRESLAEPLIELCAEPLVKLW